MIQFQVDRLRAIALEKCRSRLERSGKTVEQISEGPASYFSIRSRHGLV